MIDIRDLCKFYLVGEDRVRALDHATLHIYPQEFVSIIGPSGSGKSTLMNIIGCLDVADAGTYRLDNLPIEAYSENQLAKIRKITSASTEQAATSVTALAGGIVKAVYAETGDSVQDVMLEHGALAVLSLDGKMGVKVSCESDLKSGSDVIVTFQNGDEAAATEKSNLDGALIVSMDDKDYDIGTGVSLSTVDGKVLGTGELYIPSPWNVTAYSGVISTVWIQKGNTVSVGKTLFSLTDTGTTAQYQQQFRWK